MQSLIQNHRELWLRKLRTLATTSPASSQKMFVERRKAVFPQLQKGQGIIRSPICEVKYIYQSLTGDTIRTLLCLSIQMTWQSGLPRPRLLLYTTQASLFEERRWGQTQTRTQRLRAWIFRGDLLFLHFLSKETASSFGLIILLRLHLARKIDYSEQLLSMMINHNLLSHSNDVKAAKTQRQRGWIFKSYLY